MSIANAVQRGSWVHVYNEKNQQLLSSTLAIVQATG
jgi:hypothetical protein